MSQHLFEFSPYHVLLAATGAAIFLAYWLPGLLALRSASSSALLMTLGMLAYSFVPGMPEVLDPRTAPHFWELASEIVLIVVLFATGLRIDEIGNLARWGPTIRLLCIAMPLTIAVMALLGWGLAGMTVAGAVLLGAALAPTDPVLAGDVQVGPPLEGGEHPVRFALTAEAGLNDGLAFPFVYLGLLIAARGTDPSGWLHEWLIRDVLYRISVGVALGALVGWLLGKSLFAGPRGNMLAQSGPGVIALAAVLLAYGIVELAEGYGFIAAFVAGAVCRRVEERHEFHRRLHSFSEAVENAVTAVLLVLLGSTLPVLWFFLDWQHAAIGLGLLLVVRPLAGWLSLLGSELSTRERWFVGFFGVRGIGTVYYLAYASGHVKFVNENHLWALAVLTIFASTLIHGTTSFLVERIAAARADEAARTPASRPPPDEIAEHASPE